MDFPFLLDSADQRLRTLETGADMGTTKNANTHVRKFMFISIDI